MNIDQHVELWNQASFKNIGYQTSVYGIGSFKICMAAKAWGWKYPKWKAVSNIT